MNSKINNIPIFHYLGDENFQTDFNEINFAYGIDNERRKTIETKTQAGVTIYSRTKFYSMNYEKEQISVNGVLTNREISYIFAPDGLTAIYETKNGESKMYFTSTDHLGSINLIVDGSNGNVVDDLSYDAWGRNRNPVNWTYSNITLSSITDRGYTSHEHLPNFGLINMNGRVYDPMTMNFLSPDPFVQNPSNSQNYNRYSYCLNNPLKYVDPSGHVFLDPWYEYMAGPKRFLTWAPEDLGDKFKDFNGRDWIKRADKFEDIANIIDQKRESYFVKFKDLLQNSEILSSIRIEKQKDILDVANEIRGEGLLKFKEYLENPNYGTTFFINSINDWETENSNNSILPESVKFSLKAASWGHNYFPNPNYDNYRHIIGSFLVAENDGLFFALFITSANENYGFLIHDIPNIESRLNGESNWAYEKKDFINNQIGILLWYKYSKNK